MNEQLQATIDGLKARFRPGSVDRTVTYYLSLGDGPDQKWTVTISPTACAVTPGKTERADCVLKTSAELFMKLVSGSYKPGVADFMTGKIKTSDLDLLKRLQQAFGF